MISTLAVVGGAAAGAGLVFAAAQLRPARPDLADVLKRLDAGQAVRQRPAHDQDVDVASRVGHRLLGPLEAHLRLPEADLDLLGISRARHVGTKALWSVFGLLFPQLAMAMLALAGASLPFALPMAVSVAFAVLFWVHPSREIKQRATRARLEFRHAIASYLERVELARATNAGAAQALARTAEVGDGWTFTRIRGALDQAELSGVTAWEALRRLGEDLDIPELARPADTIAVAGEAGATVRASLQAQARQLRVALLADAKAEANEASESMIIPVVGLVILMVAFLLFPLATQILNA
ncbi:type II secretion system F family protein [Streptomyces aculeolatus]